MANQKNIAESIEKKKIYERSDNKHYLLDN
jgi:hypothetical protein